MGICASATDATTSKIDQAVSARLRGAVAGAAAAAPTRRLVRHPSIERPAPAAASLLGPPQPPQAQWQDQRSLTVWRHGTGGAFATAWGAARLGRSRCNAIAASTCTAAAATILAPCAAPLSPPHSTASSRPPLPSLSRVCPPRRPGAVPADDDKRPARGGEDQGEAATPMGGAPLCSAKAEAPHHAPRHDQSRFFCLWRRVPPNSRALCARCS